MPYEVIEKVTCSNERCARFLGLLTSDGRGPDFRECPSGLPERPGGGMPACPMFARLAHYARGGKGAGPTGEREE